MRSINGHTVITDRDDNRLHTFKVAGTGRHFVLEKVAGPILIAAALDWHNTISPIDEGTWDDWGWSPLRNGRMSPSPSDHCAGRAIDINATQEGSQGAHALAVWRKANRWLKMRAILKRYKVLAWGGPEALGGEYGTPTNFDPMHLFVKEGVTDEQLRAVIDELGIQDDGTRTGKAAPKPAKAEPRATVVRVDDVQPGDRNASVRAVQRALNVVGVQAAHIDLDGEFGPATRAAYAAWQRKLGYRGNDADGRPGPDSLRKLGSVSGSFTVR